MSRKDFIAIAAIILELDPAIREDVARQFAAGLRRTNSQFKPELFVQAATGKVALTARAAR